MADNEENSNFIFDDEERTSESDVFSRGITRRFETLRNQIAVRVFTGSGFCAILVGLIIFILCRNFNFDRPNRINVSDQTWYKEPVYEIITESFKDTSPKAEDGLRREGQGVGDIKGKLLLSSLLTTMVPGTIRKKTSVKDILK